MTDSPPLLVLDAADVHYGQLQALFGVSLSVGEGTVVGLIGPNGAGKSTLIRTVLGLCRPTRGAVRLYGSPIGTSTPRIVRRGVAVAPEGRALFSGLTVAENLELGRLGSRRATTRSSRELLDTVLETFPVLRDRRDQVAGSLSGGEQQMLAIGRAVMAQPRLLLMDEPSLGLAPVMVQRIVEAIADLVERLGVTVLMAEQNIGVAAALSDHVAVMNAGCVVGTVHAGPDNTLDVATLTDLYWSGVA